MLEDIRFVYNQERPIWAKSSRNKNSH